MSPEEKLRLTHFRISLSLMQRRFDDRFFLFGQFSLIKPSGPSISFGFARISQRSSGLSFGNASRI